MKVLSISRTSLTYADKKLFLSHKLGHQVFNSSPHCNNKTLSTSILHFASRVVKVSASASSMGLPLSMCKAYAQPTGILWEKNKRKKLITARLYNNVPIKKHNDRFTREGGDISFDNTIIIKNHDFREDKIVKKY